jgi:predicted SAM-dependent methyltransferase
MLPTSSYNFKAILEGGISLLPSGARLFNRGTRGTDSARYCYSVWMRHLVKTQAYRLSKLGGTVVELGPGDSLGIGLVALLSGASRYIAIDVVRHADVEQNLAIFAELVELFTSRAALPASDEYPEVKPELEEYSFPEAFFDAEQMARNLAPERLEAIVSALKGESRGSSGQPPLISYVDPAVATTIISPASVEWVFSQAVLEHVDDLAGAYQACHAWLVPDGLMSHQIDFKSHGTSHTWNGHWAYPELVWRVLRGRRPYLLNREPCSMHLNLMSALGFDVLKVERTQQKSQLQRSQLAKKFQGISEIDMTTSSAFVVARKCTN